MSYFPPNSNRRANSLTGLEDVSTDRRTVTFRPNEFHEGQRLKTRGSTRTVPLWPQLAEILRVAGVMLELVQLVVMLVQRGC
jgi:hypothetical protein